MNSYIKLGIAALIPVVASVIFYLLEDKTKFKKLPYWARQLIIGVVFGAIAILGTEWGIPMNGAQVNCRDAAPLCAGLLFGAPAGLIAGVIGATERWFAVYWGIGTFTRVACSLATLCAGLYAALLRKFLFENKRPTWVLSFITGVIVEVFHLSLVFLTNINDSAKAAMVVRACTVPLIVATGLSVLVASICVAFVAHDKLRIERRDLRISQTIQRWLLLCVLIAFVLSTAFMNMVQTGIARSEASDLLKNSLENVSIDDPETNVGHTGYTKMLKRGDNVNISDVVFDQVIETKIDGIDAFIMYHHVGYTNVVVGVLPTEEIYNTRDISLYVNTFMEVLVFAVMFLLIYFLVKKVVVSKMHEVNDSLDKITGGDLTEVVSVKQNREFAELSNGINQTVAALKHYIEDAEARIDQELEFARNIQSAALPRLTNFYRNNPEFDIYANMWTAKEVGGDFYDFYFTHQGKFNFLIADVSGKGIPAAMFMMRAKTQIKSLAESDVEVNDVFEHANNGLCDGNDANMFVTAWMGSVDLENQYIEFSNAGHNPPLLKHKGKKWHYVDNLPGFVLAGMEGVKYKKGIHDVKPGDIIFCYTDGVTEAINKDEELFGEDRLLETLNSIPESTSVEDICMLVKKSVDEFAGDAPQFDDITMVAVKYNGKAPKVNKAFDEAKIEDISEITAFVEEELEKIDCPLKAITQISIAIDEIYSNIVNHAYKNSKGPAEVILEQTLNPLGVEITFVDSGRPYNPLNREDPDITLSAEEREIGGLGIFMVKKSMDDIVYEYKNEQNILHLFKKF